MNQSSRVLIQGESPQDAYYGSYCVGIVLPQKARNTFVDIPVFDTVCSAKRALNCNTSFICKPPESAQDAILEAIESGIELIICNTKTVPIHDMLLVQNRLKKSKSRLIGPGSSGIIIPGRCKVGKWLGTIDRKGSVGVVSYSAALMHEAILQTTEIGIGQSTAVCLGTYPIIGTTFMDILQLFEQDLETKGILMIADTSHHLEAVADWIRNVATKPIVALVSDQGSASFGYGKSTETFLKKKEILRRAGVFVVSHPAQMGKTILRALQDES